MKNKFLILFIGIISFLGISEVKARSYTVDNFYIDPYYQISKDNYIFYLNEYSTVIDHLYNDILEEYENSYKDEFPYYFIYVTFYFDSDSDIALTLFAFDDIVQFSEVKNSTLDVRKTMKLTYANLDNAVYGLEIYAKYKNGAYVTPLSVESNTPNGSNIANTHLNLISNTVSFANIFYSNFNFKYVLDDDDSIVISNNPFANNPITINNGDDVLQMQNLLGLNIIHDPDSPSATYRTINLNDYSYVVLSLKDYTVTEEYYSNMYVKGEYCVTPVYNYGLTAYDDTYGTRVQNICSQYYDDLTQVRMYVTKDNLKNHSVYYIKSHDSSRDNVIKVDTSVFDIHYITSENEDNPIININGKKYSIIPFDDLPSSANQNTDEDFIPGLSCQVGDFNCTTSNYYRSDLNLYDENGNFSFSSLFSNPLQLLMDVWEAIIKVFELISMLIALLPPVLQTFLFLSFMLAIILGIIKILL